MVRQEFSVDGYWKVIVLYDLDYDFSDVLVRELREIGIPEAESWEVLYELKHTAKAVTCSNEYRQVSVVLFNRHSSRRDYLNSIVHEAEHVKQAILEAYDVEDAGEDAAYTIGYLVSRMWKIVKMVLCKPKRVWGY